MSDDRIYVGNTPALLVNAQNPDDDPIDISGSTVSLEVWKPGALTAVNWAGTPSGTNYIARQCVAGDFDLAGEYKIQALVVDGVKRWLGVTVRKTVYQPGT